MLSSDSYGCTWSFDSYQVFKIIPSVIPINTYQSSVRYIAVRVFLSGFNDSFVKVRALLKTLLALIRSHELLVVSGIVRNPPLRKTVVLQLTDGTVLQGSTQRDIKVGAIEIF